MASEPARAVRELIVSLGDGPLFVHADPFSAARLVARARDKNELLDNHIDALIQFAVERALWVPAFNYDFPRTGVYDVASDPVQLGPLPERFRITRSKWRTEIPIFSIAGTSDAPAASFGDYTDPFGDESAFAELVRSDGVILYYGNTFHFNTIVHHAERLTGGPPYRYDKVFSGIVRRHDGTEKQGSLKYHVRPMGTGLEYDWAGILERAIEAGATTRLDEFPEILAASAQSLVDFFVQSMNHDPLALLDARSRHWVEPALDELGRRFVITDFESPERAVPISQE